MGARGARLGVPVAGRLRGPALARRRARRPHGQGAGERADHVRRRSGDAAVADGSITKAEGDALKQRLESDGLPLVAPPLGFRHFGFHDHGPPGLPAAAKYLGLSETQLESKLESGKTLAQVAKDEGKSVDGLVAALRTDLKQKLDQAVSDGRLTKAQEEQVLAAADQRLNDLVNGKFPAGPREFGHRGGFGFRGGFSRAPAEGLGDPGL